MKLEVVVTTLNAERGLQTLLNSVVESGLSTRNIIIVDGGSRDNTVTIARTLGIRVELTRSGSNVEVMRGAPDSIAEARNAGLDVVSSPWVVFLDADMELSPKVVEEVEAELDKGAKAVILP